MIDSTSDPAMTSDVESRTGAFNTGAADAAPNGGAPSGSGATTMQQNAPRSYMPSSSIAGEADPQARMRDVVSPAMF